MKFSVQVAETSVPAEVPQRSFPTALLARSVWDPRGMALHPLAGLGAEGDRLETVFPRPRVLVLTRHCILSGDWWGLVGTRSPGNAAGWASFDRHRTKRLCLFSEPVVQR